MTGIERTFAQGRPPLVAPAGTDAADLIAEIRRMADDADPTAVGQVINDVLSALDRATGGRLRDQLTEPPPDDGPHQSEPLPASPR